MSTVDLGIATKATELVDAARIASEDGKRLLLEKDGVNDAGETRYRLSAESQFSRYIRNVKAFLTGGISGYDHDRRVQLVFRSLVEKESNNHKESTFNQSRLGVLSKNIREVNGRSISGNAAALFIRFIDDVGLSDVFPRNAETRPTDASDLNHEYEEIPDVRFPGYEVDEDLFPPEPSRESSDVPTSHDYEYIDSQDQNLGGGYSMLDATEQSDIDEGVNHSPIEPRRFKRASMYEMPVSGTTAAVIKSLTGLPQDPQAEKVPKLGRTQLRETRLSQAAEDKIKTAPALKVRTDSEFRSGLAFPERVGNDPLLNNAIKREGFYLASLANTVKPDNFNKLSLVIDRHEFNETLKVALAQEDASKDGIAGPAFKGSKVADLLVASKILDEMLHTLEVSELAARESNRAEAEAYELKFTELEAQRNVEPLVEGDDPDDQFTPLNLAGLEPDEVFTTPQPREPTDVDSAEEGLYAHLSDVLIDER